MRKQINPELIGNIIDIFDDLLSENGVRLPKSDEEMQANDIDMSENDARIYGSDYNYLADRLKELLTAWSDGQNTISVFVDDKGSVVEDRR